MSHFGVDVGGLTVVDMAPAEGQAALAQGSVDMARSEEHTSELQSQFRISYAVFCLKKKKKTQKNKKTHKKKKKTNTTQNRRAY